jgi:hypothetical protein
VWVNGPNEHWQSPLSIVWELTAPLTPQLIVPVIGVVQKMSEKNSMPTTVPT